jgi:MFS family permease
MKLAPRWRVLLGLLVARVAFGFSFQSLPVLAPGIAEDLQLDGLAIGTLVGLFMLPGFFIALPGGMLAQRLGERRTLLAGLVAMSGGAAACALAETYDALWVARLVCGIGGAIVTVVMTKLVIDWFSGHELATAMGLFLGGYPAGIGLALIGLGALSTPTTWATGFGITAILCAAGLVAAWLTTFPQPNANLTGKRSVRLTLREVVLVTSAASVASIYNAGYLVMLGFVPMYLVAQGHAPSIAAAIMGAGVWMSILSVPLGGFVADKLKRPNTIMATGALVWATGLWGTIPLMDSALALTFLFAILSLVGAFPVGAMVALGAEATRPSSRGLGMGLYYSWFYGAAAVGPAAAGYILDRTQPWVTIALVSACGILAIIFLLFFRTVQKLLHSQ